MSKELPVEQGETVRPDPQIAERILAMHLEKYDHVVAGAHDFVKDKLGMVDVLPADRTAVLPKEVAERWGVGTAGGHYYPELDLAYVFEQDSGRPKTDALVLGVSLVHELAHAATLTAERAAHEHNFYNEALAGMAEYFALENLAAAGEFTRPDASKVTRIIDGKELTITIPGDIRRVDASEVIDGQADTTQALIAATVIGAGLKRLGKSGKEILAEARRDDGAAYDTMKAAVASLDPALEDFITQQPQTTEGIIRIAHAAQQLAPVL